MVKLLVIAILLLKTYWPTKTKALPSFLRLMIVVLCFYSQLLFADEPGVEYKIKAAYIYNFTKFITWPEDGVATFNLCILGEDPFGDLIDPIENRNVLGRPIKIHRVDNYDASQQCHILYISDAGFQIKKINENQGITKPLTVSENDEFAIKGGMIGFVSKDRKIKLQMNLDALKQGGLKSSAKLLEVAEIIQGKRP